LTNDELIKTLKYLARKKTATRQEINKHLNSKEDITDSKLFYDHTTPVSDHSYVNGRYVPCPDETFKLSVEGRNLLAEHIKESKAIRRVNLSLLLSLAAVLIAAAALAYSIFRQ